MAGKSSLVHLAFISLLSLSLSGCFRPPYNNFKPYHRANDTSVPGIAVGAAATIAAGGAPILAGAALGGAVGASVGLYKDSKPRLIRELKKLDIQYIEYGDTVTFVVPTDKYFMFESARFNELCFPGLSDLIKLIKTFPICCRIYVAGFTDNVGSRYSKRMLTQARAERMVAFLWANDIPSQRLVAEGYGDKHPVGDNRLIHGSAFNRRLEIQVFKNCSAPVSSPYLAPMK
ncbi:MAG: OmpA family protein [Tatlockia sp.]|nr:OmpA family protein [Tatlockia sp.]